MSEGYGLISCATDVSNSYVYVSIGSLKVWLVKFTHKYGVIVGLTGIYKALKP